VLDFRRHYGIVETDVRTSVELFVLFVATDSKKYSTRNLLTRMKLILIGVILPLVLFLLLNSNGSLVGASSSYGIFTKESSPYQTPYREWIGKWWTWWLGIPDSLHPTNNYSDTKRCSVMQDGPVWYIPDIIVDVGTVTANCDVPFGKAILVPLSTTICETGGEPSMTDTELAQCADNILTPVSNIDVNVDGRKVDVSKSFDKSGFFNFTFPQDPVRFWGDTKPGPERGIATGYFLFLHDLPRGEHDIKFSVVDLLRGKEGPPPRYENVREGSFKISIQ